MAPQAGPTPRGARPAVAAIHLTAAQTPGALCLPPSPHRSPLGSPRRPRKLTSATLVEVADQPSHGNLLLSKLLINFRSKPLPKKVAHQLSEANFCPKKLTTDFQEQTFAFQSCRPTSSSKPELAAPRLSPSLDARSARGRGPFARKATADYRPHRSDCPQISTCSEQRAPPASCLVRSHSKQRGPATKPYPTPPVTTDAEPQRAFAPANNFPTGSFAQRTTVNLNVRSRSEQCLHS